MSEIRIEDAGGTGKRKVFDACTGADLSDAIMLVEIDIKAGKPTEAVLTVKPGSITATAEANVKDPAKLTYVVVHDELVNALANRVQQYINNGWEPLGGISVVCKCDGCLHWVQAMIKRG